MTQKEISETLKKAAKSVCIGWPGVIEEADLVQELWVWYLTSPAVQHEFEDPKSDYSPYQAARHQAVQVLSKTRDANARSIEGVYYTVDEVVGYLQKEDLSQTVLDDLGEAFGHLWDRNPGQAEALSIRYGEGYGRPMTPRERDLLTRARTSLTDEMNRAHRRQWTDYMGFSPRSSTSWAETE